MLPVKRGGTIRISSKRVKAISHDFWNPEFMRFSQQIAGFLGDASLLAQTVEERRPTFDAYRELDFWELLKAGGTIGWIIMALSVAMVALIIEHFLTVRRTLLMPPGMSDDIRSLIALGNFKQAERNVVQYPSFLGRMLTAGLAEVGLGYSVVEKAMEDAASQQAARLFRKLEYFTIIGTIAPMLGLLGTVWGMILAFMEFEVKANPQVSELAPGIYKALVTTLQGLCVAIPSLAAYSVLRNRVDELIAETVLAAEYTFAGFKREPHRKRSQQLPAVTPRTQKPDAAAEPGPSGPGPREA